MPTRSNFMCMQGQDIGLLGVNNLRCNLIIKRVAFKSFERICDS